MTKDEILRHEMEYIRAYAMRLCLSSNAMDYVGGMLEILTHAGMALDPPSNYKPEKIPGTETHYATRHVQPDRGDIPEGTSGEEGSTC